MYDPHTKKHIGATIRFLLPRMPRTKDLHYAIEKWKEGPQCQQELTGEAPFDDAAKRALLTGIAPEDFAKHLKLNVRRLGSYEKVRREVTSYITLAAPSATVGMYVGDVGTT